LALRYHLVLDDGHVERKQRKTWQNLGCKKVAGDGVSFTGAQISLKKIVVVADTVLQCRW